MGRRLSKLTFWGALLTVRLHSNMGVQVVQSTICLLTSIPSALVHTLNLLITTAGTLMLLGTWDRNERVDLCQMLLTISCTGGVEEVKEFNTKEPSKTPWMTTNASRMKLTGIA